MENKITELCVYTQQGFAIKVKECPTLTQYVPANDFIAFHLSMEKKRIDNMIALGWVKERPNADPIKFELEKEEFDVVVNEIKKIYPEYNDTEIKVILDENHPMVVCTYNESK